MKILKIALSPITLVLSILIGAILGAIGLVTYWFYWTFKSKELWKQSLQK